MFLQIISITPCELAFNSLQNSRTPRAYTYVNFMPLSQLLASRKVKKSSVHEVVKKIVISEPQRYLLVVLHGKILFFAIRELSKDNGDSTENATKQQFCTCVLNFVTFRCQLLQNIKVKNTWTHDDSEFFIQFS